MSIDFGSHHLAMAPTAAGEKALIAQMQSITKCTQVLAKVFNTHFITLSIGIDYLLVVHDERRVFPIPSVLPLLYLAPLESSGLETPICGGQLFH